MEQETITLRNTFKVGGLIMIIPIIVNSIIFFIGDMQDVFNVQLMDQDFSVVPVIFLTIVFLIGASIGFYILTTNLNQSREQIRIFAVIAVLLTLALPFTIAGASTAFRLTLLSMHIITGFIAISGFTTSYLWDKV